MAGSEHFMFAQESAFGTWVTPTKALPVRTVNIAGTQPILSPDETGGGRGQRPGQPGEIGVKGSVVTTLHPTVLPFLLRSVFATRASSGVAGTTVAITSNSIASPTVVTTGTAHGFTNGQTVFVAGVTTSSPTINGSRVVTVIDTTHFSVPVAVTVAGTGGTVYAGVPGFRTKMLVDDNTSFNTFSIQKRYKSSLAESIRGAKLSQFQIAVKAKEFATCSMDFVGKDATISGGLWSDGTTAPAVVDPVPYEAVYVEALKFYQGVIKLGGTVALTSGELVVTGGTARNDFDNVELTANFNVGDSAYGVNIGDRTVQSLDEGRREITVKFEPNFDTTGNEFYLLWKAGTPALVQLFFQGTALSTGKNYEVVITLPYVIYSNGGTPELNNAYGLKRQTIEGMAFVDPVTGYDIGIAIQSTEDLTA